MKGSLYGFKSIHFWLLLLADFIHASAISVSASSLFGGSLLLNVPSFTLILLISSGLTLFILLFIRIKIFRRIVLFAALAFLVIGAALISLSLVSDRFREPGARMLAWIASSVSGFDVAVAAPYALTAGISAISAVYVAVGKRWVYIVSSLPFAALIIFSFLNIKFSPFWLGVFALSMILLVIRKKYENYYRLLAGDSPRSMKRFALPSVRALCLIAALAVLAAFVRPQLPETSLFGEGVSESISSGIESFVVNHPGLNNFLRNVFGLEFSSQRSLDPGTQGKYESLGGKIDPGHDPILAVYSDRDVEYLRGFTFGDYTGNSWVLDKNNGPNGRISISFDTSPPFYVFDHAVTETKLAIFRFLPTYDSVIPDYVLEFLRASASRRISVKYLLPYDPGFGLFTPAGTVSLSLMARNVHESSPFASSYLLRALEETGLGVSEGNSLAYVGTSAPAWIGYTAEYKDLSALFENDTSRNVKKIFRPGFYDALAEESILGAKKMAAYSRDVYAAYTKLPETVTDRTRELAVRLTEELETDWDKAVAIRNYLRSGEFRYTLSPQEQLAGTDFVDDFLFRTKEGYCTYFASAMTVLARAAGIPARYVNGFLLSPDAETADSDGYRILTEEHLHAWCEIYLEGAGFIKIEATAGFGEGSSSPARPSSAPLPSPTPSPTAEPEPTETPDPGEEPTEEPDVTATPSSDPGATPAPSPTTEPETTPPPSGTDGKGLPAFAAVLIILLAAAILILLVLRLLIYLSRRPPGNGKTGRKEKTIALYRRCEAVLARVFRDRSPSETPAEYLRSLEVLNGTPGSVKKPVPEAMVVFACVTSLFEKVMYSAPEDSDLPPAPADDTDDYWDEFTTALTDALGKAKTALLLIRTMGR